ncbi:MAG: hypothetical protein FXF47_06300 [Candidatus Mcinerneyibacterium aminivorans]|uniref:Putative manganese efflux pump MntP n=1 Tax=Candidatus Mcinerneyibacterium aminivorans TaxID=2703815 RepID=A0A5D0MHQ2_9BACT|nr:MAG: hypothetical protein FXF47_06300 [Candidatus Mcinerneyibacterium aminivorans]
MNLIYIFAIAVSVAIDAFVVGIAYGFELRKINLKHFFLISIFFSFFQMFMPVIGFLLINSLKQYIIQIDHWIIFFILTFVGGKMIYDAFWVEDKVFDKCNFNYKILFLLSIATSIDAFSIGLTLPLLDYNLFLTVVIIGVVTFLLVFLAIYLGKVLGKIFDEKIDIIGGIILIALGVKILLEHLYGAG